MIESLFAVLFVLLLLVVVVSFAVFVLAWRDRRRWRKRDNARSFEERIEEVRISAATAMKELPELRSDMISKHPDWDEAWSWIDPVIEFNRRLESLAASKDTTAEEATDLANEAGEFLRQRKLKGVLVADSAARLARLIQKRDSVGRGESI